jgi:hypothetical protein
MIVPRRLNIGFETELRVPGVTRAFIANSNLWAIFYPPLAHSQFESNVFHDFCPQQTLNVISAIEYKN